jgi:hypothetical protein
MTECLKYLAQDSHFDRGSRIERVRFIQVCRNGESRLLPKLHPKI